MDDDVKTVADYKIVENGFIVMMVAKVGTLDLYLTFYTFFSLPIVLFSFILLSWIKASNLSA